jgi:hypothetical protein
MKYVDIDDLDGIVLMVKGEPVAVVGIEPTMSEDLTTYENYDSYNVKGYALKHNNGQEVSNFSFVTAQVFYKVCLTVTEEYLGALDRLAWRKERAEKAKLS